MAHLSIQISRSIVFVEVPVGLPRFLKNRDSQSPLGLHNRLGGGFSCDMLEAPRAHQRIARQLLVQASHANQQFSRKGRYVR